MRSFCRRIIEDFASSVDVPELSETPWYLITGKAGPNAVLKIILPPARGRRGSVLTVARHTTTGVINHEVAILNRLKRSRRPHLTESIPNVLVHGRCDGVEYFGVPFYESYGHHRVARRLARNKRARWVEQWLAELARETLDYALTRECIEQQYAATLSKIQDEPEVSAEVKRRVQRSFETVCDNARQIPSVCCHGDVWTGNILWQRRSKGAMVLDWGAARWPGLPCVDLCRYCLANLGSNQYTADAIARYCRAIDLDPVFASPLYDLYNLFIKAELDEAYAFQPENRYDPFVDDHSLPSHGLAREMAALREL